MTICIILSGHLTDMYNMYIVQCTLYKSMTYRRFHLYPPFVYSDDSIYINSVVIVDDGTSTVRNVYLVLLYTHYYAYAVNVQYSTVC